jgi:hypothetical protein
VAADRTPPTDITAELPALTGAVRPLRMPEQPRTLASMLIPSIDKIRQIPTMLGLRPKRVFLVHAVWNGPLGKKGDGAPVEVSRTEILPTPKVADMEATTQILHATGLSEEGGLRITEISARFSEDDLMGRTPDLQDAADPRTSRRGAEFYWEVVDDRPNAPTGVRRQYVPSDVPELSKDGCQWRISLIKRDGDRSRAGAALPRREF